MSLTKNHVTVLKRRIVAISAILLVGMAAVTAAAAPPADAAAVTTISGTVIKTDSNTRGNGVPVYLLRANGGSWVYTNISTTANSAGNYVFPPVARGPEYLVQGYAQYGRCTYGGAGPSVALYNGYSVGFYATGPTVHATVNIGFLRYVYC